MKKIYMILAVAALVGAAAACQKNEVTAPEAQPAAQNVTVNITVSSLTPETRAIKTGWENGDVLHVYLDDATSYEPDFDLTFDGSKWMSSGLSAGVIARLKATGGYLHGFWEDTNVCMSNASWDKYSGYIEFPGHDDAATTGVYGHLVADFSSIPYTYDSVKGIVSANIKSWRFRTDLQVVITGITFTPGKYTLYSDRIHNLNMITVNDGTPGETYTGYTGSGKAYGNIAGIKNDDGVAFIGAISTTSSTDYVINLKDNETGVVYTFEKKSMALSSDSNTKVVAIKIPISKFFVDMGLGVKWGTHNLGATASYPYFPTEDTEEARQATWGDYYAWGELAPYYADGRAYTAINGFGWKSGMESGYDWPSYKFDNSVGHDGTSFSKYTTTPDALEDADDVVIATLGGNWRMPTYAEWQELLNTDNCTWTWDATNKLYKVTSKKTGYESQYIFLPAAGYRNKPYLVSSEIEGRYWSSKFVSGYYDGQQAYFIGFQDTPASIGGGTTYRYMGESIRPVHP